jgi:hypothetical protein
VWAQGVRQQFPSQIIQENPYVGAPATSPSLPPSVAPGSFWDPYATPPGAVTPGPPPISSPSPAFPAEGMIQPQPGGSFSTTPPGEWYRLFKDRTIRYTWLYDKDSDANQLQISDVELHATAQWPLIYDQPPLEITPGFAFHFWEGPQTEAPDFFELPGLVYDAYLATGWRPNVTERIKADVEVLVGVFSDFQYVDERSLRVRGHGLGIFSYSPTMDIVAGIEYVNRDRIKLLPAGGLICRPNPNWTIEAVFPHPKVSRRWTTIGTTEWGWYVAGEYGGGAWTIERDMIGHEGVDYSDIRVLGGLEWESVYHCRGYFEVGYVFNREVTYKITANSFDPEDTVMLRAGVVF